jgi:hypothetical protein
MVKLDQETAKYLVEKSDKMLEKQIESYRQKQSNSSTILGVNALFIPFFLSGLRDSSIYIQLFAIIPILGIGTAMFLLLKIYKPNKLMQGLNVNSYNDVINEDYDNALLREIGVNRECFNTNIKILDGTEKSYFWAVKLTMIAIAISISLLTLNKFFKPISNKVTTEASFIKTNNSITLN